jgi:SAM-dependent methyltransferase
MPEFGRESLEKSPTLQERIRMQCSCCGSAEMQACDVLWPRLIDEWQLASHEVAYINRQQGLHCLQCGSNLRTMALAKAVMTCHASSGSFIEFVNTEVGKSLRTLEINEAGQLTPFLIQMPYCTPVRYPAVDMMSLPFPDASFDLVVHSETLEHVPHPVRGLSECRRVLVPGGFCVFTVPIVVDRLTRSRAGLPPSYHGSPDNPGDYLVQTEYGADAWKHLFQAQFAECRIICLEYPGAMALVGVR